MECIFLNAAGTTLFVRDDMESGHWVQQEMNLTADFPFVDDKKIQRGQRIAFRDPETDIIEVFEIKVVTNQEPDHYQQITAEHICISELMDDHINSQQITNQTAAQALVRTPSRSLFIFSIIYLLSYDSTELECVYHSKSGHFIRWSNYWSISGCGTGSRNLARASAFFLQKHA